MIEVFENLFVGTQIDFEAIEAEGLDGWSIVHACKEPHHRAALGYTGRAAPSDHEEYLVALRGERLILNMVDAADPKYMRPELYDAALPFIDDALARGQKVLVHCNQGASRSPTLALLWLNSRGHVRGTFEEAEAAFKETYPDYAPANGARCAVELQWTLHGAEA